MSQFDDAPATEAQDTTATSPASEPAAVTHKRRARLDTDAGAVIVMVDGKPIAPPFAVGEMPANAKAYLLLHGLWVTLRDAENPAEAYSRLMAGEVPQPRVAAPALKLTNWRQAIALWLVDRTKKTEAPLSLDAARERAAELPRAEVDRCKLEPGVIKHFLKLTGKAPPAHDALLAA